MVEIAIVYVQSLRQPFGLVTFYVKRITVKEKFEMILIFLPSEAVLIILHQLFPVAPYVSHNDLQLKKNQFQMCVWVVARFTIV